MRAAVLFVLLLGACSPPVPQPEGSASDIDPASVTIAFGGDVNLGRRQNAISASDGADRALGDLSSLREADLAIVNLESVVSGIGQSGVEKGEDAPFFFRGRPEMLDVLIAAGVDAVGTANNHSGDYGPDALLDQGRLLDAAGVAHAGSGPDVEAACAPTYLPAAHLTVALVSIDATMPHFAATDASPGTCHLALEEPQAWRERMGPILEDARDRAHAVLVAVHWGPNLAAEPSAEKRAVGRLLIELGADVVLGSSAHVLQGVEVHEGRPIVHDAGNLLFDSQEGVVDSALMLLDLDSRGVRSLRVEPLVTEYGWTRPASPAESGRIVDEVAALSRSLGTELMGGRLPLDPPVRAEPEPQPVPQRQPALTPPAADPPPGCLAAEVPAEFAIPPLRLGELTLLGVRVDPVPADPRKLVWVESYWRVDSGRLGDRWISPRLEPSGGGGTWRGDHQPCDWAWPAGRMVPGQIYLDRSALRPRNGAGDELVLRMAVTDGEDTLDVSEVLARVPMMGE